MLPPPLYLWVLKQRENTTNEKKRKSKKKKREKILCTPNCEMWMLTCGRCEVHRELLRIAVTTNSISPWTMYTPIFGGSILVNEDVNILFSGLSVLLLIPGTEYWQGRMSSKYLLKFYFSLYVWITLHGNSQNVLFQLTFKVWWS